MAPKEARVFNMRCFCKWIGGGTNPSLTARSVKNGKFLYFIFPYSDGLNLELLSKRNNLLLFDGLFALVVVFFPSCSERYYYTSIANFVGFWKLFFIEKNPNYSTLFKKLNYKLKTKYEKRDCSQSSYLSGLVVYIYGWILK